MRAPSFVRKQRMNGLSGGSSEGDPHVHSAGAATDDSEPGRLASLEPPLANIGPSPSQVAAHGHSSLAALTLAAVGVVYGDIGTSPLYALKECLSPHYGLGRHARQRARPAIADDLVADHGGDREVPGVHHARHQPRRGRHPGAARAVPRAAALLGAWPRDHRDGAGRVRRRAALRRRHDHARHLRALGRRGPRAGDEHARSLGGADRLRHPDRAVRGAALRHGARRRAVRADHGAVVRGAGRARAPTTSRSSPAVLVALSPHYAVAFLLEHGFAGFAVLGSVVLCVTGGEALYADMGHFGLRPIRYAWNGLVMPSLLLAYFGQGANVLAHPEAAANPFYALVPEGLPMYALIGLATVAAVIASQALISGAYSLTHQAVQLGLFPRVTVQHTSSQHRGADLPARDQLVPGRLLHRAGAALRLVVGAGGRLRHRRVRHHGHHLGDVRAGGARALGLVAARSASPLLALFLVFDLGFLAANLLKFAPRRLRADRGGRGHLAADAHLDHRPLQPGRVLQRARPELGRLHRAARQGAHRAPRRGRRVHGVRRARCAADDAAPGRAHPRRARARAAGDRAFRARATRAARASASPRSPTSATASTAWSRATASCSSPRCHRSSRRWPSSCGCRGASSEVTYYLGRESLVAGPGGTMGPMLESVFRMLVAQRAAGHGLLPPAARAGGGDRPADRSVAPELALGGLPGRRQAVVLTRRSRATRAACGSGESVRWSSRRGRAWAPRCW